MSIPKVYANFQNLDDDNRLKLTCAGTLEDLERQGIHLSAGLSLILCTDDADKQGRPDELCAEGVVQHNAEEKCWVAAIDWSKLYHASEQASQNSDGHVQRETAAIQKARTKG